LQRTALRAAADAERYAACRKSRDLEKSQ
jgi:hypothetical protein